MTAHALVVTSCVLSDVTSDCPFFRVERGRPDRCVLADQDRTWVAGGPPRPDWCPLNSGTVIVMAAGGGR